MTLPRPKPCMTHLCCGHGPLINDKNGHWYACDVASGGCGEVVRGDDKNWKAHKAKCQSHQEKPYLRAVPEDWEHHIANTQAEFVTFIRHFDYSNNQLELLAFNSKRGNTNIVWRTRPKI